MFYITSLSEFCESNKRDDAKHDAGLKTPDDVLALGSSCRVIRNIDEHDDVFYHRDEMIDWDTINELNMLYKTGIFEEKND